MSEKPTHIRQETYKIGRVNRVKRNGHAPLLLWFTGLSGSGKSTIANAVEELLFEKNYHTYALDGDNIRFGLNSNLGFSPEDRSENIRRIAEVAKLFLDAGHIVTAAFVSPYQADRDLVKTIVGAAHVVEVYVNTPLEVCEARDIKGLYKKARAGEIKNLTGISAPYEVPDQPDLEINTAQLSVDEAAGLVIQYVEQKLTELHEQL